MNELGTLVQNPFNSFTKAAAVTRSLSLSLSLPPFFTPPAAARPSLLLQPWTGFRVYSQFSGGRPFRERENCVSVMLLRYTSSLLEANSPAVSLSFWSFTRGQRLLWRVYSSWRVIFRRRHPTCGYFHCEQLFCIRDYLIISLIDWSIQFKFFCHIVKVLSSEREVKAMMKTSWAVLYNVHVRNFSQTLYICC